MKVYKIAWRENLLDERELVEFVKLSDLQEQVNVFIKWIDQSPIRPKDKRLLYKRINLDFKGGIGT